MKKVKGIILCALFFILTLVVSDIFINLTYISNVSSTDFYEDIGRGKRKNLSYVYFNEGFGIGRFNEHRFIGDDIVKNEEDVIRFALIGDSYVEAFHVFQRDYFGNIADSILSVKFNKEFEFLNFGRSGFNISDMYAYQMNMIDKFKPDFFIYFISNDDLNLNNTDKLLPEASLIDDDLKIVLDFKEVDVKKYNNIKMFIQNSTIASMLNDCRKKLEVTSIWSVLLDKLYRKPKKDYVEANKDLRTELDPVLKEIINNFNSERVLIVNRGREELNPKVQTLIEANNLRFIDFSVITKNMSKEGVDPYFWKVTKKKGHWNRVAHFTLGTELASFLENNLNFQ